MSFSAALCVVFLSFLHSSVASFLPSISLPLSLSLSLCPHLHDRLVYSGSVKRACLRSWTTRKELHLPARGPTICHLAARPRPRRCCERRPLSYEARGGEGGGLGRWRGEGLGLVCRELIWKREGREWSKGRNADRQRERLTRADEGAERGGRGGGCGGRGGLGGRGRSFHPVLNAPQGSPLPVGEY